MKTSSYFSVNTSLFGPTVRADVRWAGQVVVIQGLDYLSSIAEQKLWYLGASVMLFSCSGRERNALQYGERLRKQQLCKHEFQQVRGRVRRPVDQGKRLSLCYQTLSGLLRCRSRLQILIRGLPLAVV